MACRDLLPGCGGAGDGDAGCVRLEACPKQIVHERGEIAAGHVDGEGGICRDGTGPDGYVGRFTCRVMTGDEDEFRRAEAIGEGQMESGTGGEDGGDAGNDLDGNVGFAEGGELFGGAAKDEGVA